MTKQELIQLLENASRLIRGYEMALDNHLYRNRDTREDIKMCEDTLDQIDQAILGMQNRRGGG